MEYVKNLETSWANNSRILRIKNAKFSRYCFYMNTNIWGHFQICISVPLMKTLNVIVYFLHSPFQVFSIQTVDKHIFKINNKDTKTKTMVTVFILYYFL